jgi:hypothetical protein
MAASGPWREQNWFQTENHLPALMMRTTLSIVPGSYHSTDESGADESGHCVGEVEETQELATEKESHHSRRFFLTLIRISEIMIW